MRVLCSGVVGIEVGWRRDLKVPRGRKPRAWMPEVPIHASPSFSYFFRPFYSVCILIELLFISTYLFFELAD